MSLVAEPAGRDRGARSVRAPRAPAAGYTMIEVMVAVLIIGLALLATTPALRTSLVGHRLKGGAEELQAKMRLARSRAIAENVPVILAWNADDGQFYLVVDDDQDGTPDWGDETAEGPFCTPKGVKFDNDPKNPFPNTWVAFNPDGSTDASGRVVIEDEKGRKMYVDVVQPSGMVTILTEKDLGYEK